MVNAFSFSCHACGKCCNTPPSMTLAELFRHRDRFVGCIAIGRVRNRREGERLRVGRHETVLDAADIAAFDSIAQTLLHRAGETFSITTQGYDYPSVARCPALEDDGRCAIHFSGKPVTCEVVPLDPLVPDRLQHLVLAARNRSGAYFGVDCIREGEHDDAALLVSDGEIVDTGARHALTSRRDALARERDVWGQAVFESLRQDLFNSPAALARIPADGFMTLSLVPAILAVAGTSERCRELCLAYIDSQIALIDRYIQQALMRRRLDDRPVTQELRGFANAYKRAAALLAVPLANERERGDASFALDVETYLSGAAV